MRTHTAADRRSYHRFEEHGLMARIGDKLHEVHDIAVGGMRVMRLETPVGGEMGVTLYPREGRQLALSQGMAVRCEVVGHLEDWTRLRFVSVSYTLAKFLIHHLARCHGVEPYIFK